MHVAQGYARVSWLSGIAHWLPGAGAPSAVRGEWVGGVGVGVGGQVCGRLRLGARRPRPPLPRQHTRGPPLVMKNLPNCPLSRPEGWLVQPL